MEEKTYVSSYENSVAQTTLFRSVYLWMTFALIVTGVTSLIVAGNEQLTYAIFSNRIAFYGIMIAELAMVFFLSAKIDSLSFTTATLMFALYSILNGITLSFIFLVYTASSIASTFFITAGTFGAMSLIGFFTKKDLSSIGNFLYMALIGVIIATLVNLFLHSSTLDWIVTYIGLFVFIGLTAYDTQKIKRMTQQCDSVNDGTQKIALMGALSLYLDFINMFLYLLRIFGRRN